MTTLNLQVNADENDAYNYAGTARNTKLVVFLNYATGSTLHSAFRFVSVTIGQGDLIESASLDLFVFSGSLDDFAFDIYAEDVDNSGVIEGGASIPGRTRTTATVNWTAPNAGVGSEVSPDISDVIQEVVDRGGWASGNALTILGVDPQSAAGASVHDYQEFPATAAELDIVHTAGGAPPIASQRLKSGTGR
jgi:hypothetical protein